MAELIAKQAVAILVLAGAVVLVHRAAMRRLFAHGG